MTESDIAAIRDQVKELPEVLDVALGYSVVRRSAVLALLVDTPSVEPAGLATRIADEIERARGLVLDAATKRVTADYRAGWLDALEAVRDELRSWDALPTQASDSPEKTT